MNWDLNDIRYFLAVARAGSTLGAAKALRVNQTTCARRIAALEQAFDLKLFERAPSGYSLTASGAALRAHAEEVEAGAARLLKTAQELSRAERAEIKFSTSDVLADLVAGAAIASFALARPDIRVSLHVDSRAVDLTDQEADIALRAAPVMDDPRLVVRKVMETPWAFYRAARGGEDHAGPTGPQDLSRYPLATLEGRPADMLRAAIPGANIRYVSNSMKALIEVIATGECVGALPMLVGEGHVGLKRCFALDLDAGGLWLVFHERLRAAPHARAFVDHFTASIQAWRRGLAGAG